MASLFTDIRKTEMYRFTTVAFSAAPGAFFLEQLREAVEAGLSTRQIVNLFTTKQEFLSVYPASMSNEVFAAALAHNVIKSSTSAGAITDAIQDILSALNAGLSRGDVIFNVFGQLADRVTAPGTPGFNPNDPYLGVAQQFNNQVAVGRHFTEVLGRGDQTLPPLQQAISQVTNFSDVSSTAAIEELIRAGANAASSGPSVSVGQASVTEGASGERQLSFVVSLSQPSGSGLVVNVKTEDGTATAGSDYTPLNQQITFAAGQTQRTVNVTVRGDNQFETNESIVLVASGQQIANTGRGIGVILNDDVPAPTFFEPVANTAAVNEGQSVTFSVGTLNVAPGTLIPYALTGTTGAADLAGNVPRQGSLAVGSDGFARLTVTTLADGLTEGAESIVFQATPMPGRPSTPVTVTVNDTSRGPASTIAVQSSPVSQSEGNAGSTSFQFTLTRTGDLSGSASASFAVSGIASAGSGAASASDFVGGVFPSGTVSFAPGQSTATLMIPVIGDLTAEPDESFQLLLTGTANAALGTITRTTGTIMNDDLNGDDFRQDGMTNGRVSVGGAASGNAETARDRDWFAVDLVAGVQYRFTQQAIGTGTFDPWLVVRDANGQLISSNDDFGGVRTSQIDFIPNASGMYFLDAGGWETSTGRYQVSVSQLSGAVASTPGNDTSRFNVTVQYQGSTASSQVQQAINEAVSRIEDVVTGDLPSFNLNGRLIDDVLITVRLRFIDGPGGTLAQAAPTAFRSTGAQLPSAGFVEFDVSDINSQFALNAFSGLALHEMIHVLGFGSQGFRSRDLASGNRYDGITALTEFRKLSNPNATFIPLEDSGGTGSAGSHWEDGLFFGEIMGAFYSRGEPSALSRISVAALADLGYQVNLNGADPFTFTRTSAQSEAPPADGVALVGLPLFSKMASEVIYA